MRGRVAKRARVPSLSVMVPLPDKTTGHDVAAAAAVQSGGGGVKRSRKWTGGVRPIAWRAKTTALVRRCTSHCSWQSRWWAVWGRG